MSWGRRRKGDWGGWPRYVPVAERKEKARKQAEKLRKKGDSLSPVVVAGRIIAATFWGKAWCRNLERYGDYENRIPRGRAYVRNGSVLDLKIAAARVDALVSGSHLYSVAVEIRPLKAQVWKGVKKACTGRIGSLLELLQGKLSREVMEIVTSPQTGLFPEPADVSFRCSCPDWASMCKHVAAVLYGIGARLDREPELLFRLRDVDHRELIAVPDAADLVASSGMGDKMISEEDLAGIFGIEIDEGPKSRRLVPAPPVPPTPRGGWAPRVRKELSLPQPARNSFAASEKPAPDSKKSRKSLPTPRTQMPEPEKPRRGRPPKTVVSVMPPIPPKRERGRPRLSPKTASADQTAPLMEEPRPKRPKLRPAFLKALREEAAARKRQDGKEASSSRRNTVSGKDRMRKDAVPNPAPAPLPTRKRGRPPGKREA